MYILLIFIIIQICSPESAEDASQAGSLPSEMETEIYDCREALEPKKKR